jgi:hypothetical protein
MDDFLRNARKHIEDIDLERLLKDIDFSRFDKDQLKHIDFSKGTKKIRQQLREMDLQKREEEAASEGFLGGLILGVIVGAVLALIFAPRSGSETREMVAKTATDLSHKAEGLVSHKDETVTEDLGVSHLPDEPAIERDFGSSSRPNSSVF